MCYNVFDIYISRRLSLTTSIDPSTACWIYITQV